MAYHKLVQTIIATSCLIAAVIVTCCNKDGQPAIVPVVPTMNTKVLDSTPLTPERGLMLWSEAEEDVMFEEIRLKLQPQELRADENKVLEPHQFLHLHHMKTGGTSIDHLIKCARERLAKDFDYTVNHYTIHECARGKFHDCLTNSTDVCRNQMTQASSMSYCAALKHLHTFGWDEERIRAVTVLRHPVERVWSMFRFETRQCYKCKNLTEIYDIIDSGDTRGYDSLCLAQLQNHETANLLTSDWPQNTTDAAIVQEAIDNMKNFFIIIGLTEELAITSKILGTVFPWLNKTFEDSHSICSLPHDNSSPTNNHCVKQPRTDGRPGIMTTHWDLPNHPDEETRKAIEAHNQLDLQLYEAAVQYFALQKKAFEANEEEESRQRHLN